MNDWRTIALQYHTLIENYQELCNSLIVRLAQHEDVAEYEEQLNSLERRDQHV